MTQDKWIAFDKTNFIIMERKHVIQSTGSALRKMGDRLQKQAEDRKKNKQIKDIKKLISSTVPVSKWKR